MELIKSPSAPEIRLITRTNDLNSEALFGSGAFDNLDDDEATTTDNEQNNPANSANTDTQYNSRAPQA